ncbi:MAG: TonB family protein [Microscillaceae bacterium]|nr:TonB family protein [Microscillaceae bacterium]
MAASALRALQSYPEPWLPGKQAGQPVRVKFTLPIAFKADAAPTAPTPPAPQEEETFVIVETPPQPKEGFEDFYKYLASQLRYPAEARRMGVEGRVFVQFMVDKDGSLTEIKVLKGIGAGCDEEAVRVLRAYPHLWEPGKQEGKAVRVRMSLPLAFKLSGEKNDLAMIVIDEVQYRGQALEELLANQKLEMENIREIHVLKGDEAVARYGEAARNGVVLIYTNKPEAAPASEKPALAFYPNPAREMMNLRFTLKEAAPVRITAQEMRTASREVVLEKHFEAGEHLFGWVVASLAPRLVHLRNGNWQGKVFPQSIDREIAS